MRNLLLSALILAVGCASAADRPASVAQPQIVIRQAGPLFFGSLSTTSVSIDVQVTNRASVPLRLREVDVSSPGMTQYTLQRTTKLFNEVIPPGETRTVGLVATAIAQDTRSPMSEPLMVRAFLRFEAAGTSFREILTEQFVGSS